MKSAVLKPISFINGAVKTFFGDHVDQCNNGADAVSVERQPLINGCDKIVDLVQASAKKPYGLGKRHVQILLLFSGYALTYSHKVNLSVGIVAMEAESERGISTYDWDESTRGLILSSLFWGYMLSPIPVGIIAHRYGAKLPLFFAIFISSIATLFTPIAAAMGWYYLCALRILIGMMQGSVCPCLHTLLSEWVHPSERGFLSSVTYSGGKIGIILTMAFSGVVASSRLGWPAIFYYSGGFSLIWTLVWFIYGFNCPAEDQSISKEELEFIYSAEGRSSKDEKQQIPWKDIWSSPPFLCLIFVHAAASWGYFLLLTEVPSYISGVFHFDIKSNALFSALPYLVMLIILIILSHLSDMLLGEKYFSVIIGRKLFNTIGMWIPMLCLFGMAYVGRNSAMAIFLLTMAIGLNAGVYIGFFINHMDLSPNFAGTLVGVTSAFANVMSVFAPIFVGNIVTDKSDPSLWNTVFIVSGGIYFVGNLLFLLFGEGTVQNWNGRKSGLCKLV